jgi:dienelactone hydrolase
MGSGAVMAASAFAHVHAAADPGLPGTCSVISQTVTIASVQAEIYYPSACTGGLAAPFPGIVFAHGFSMFGLSNGAAENAGNSEHLASWGYIVAIPRLPDDAETRITQTVGVLNYLESAAVTPGSFLYQTLDTGRLATAGHSLGGSTALAVAARDARIKAVVALDPVYHEGAFGQEGQPIWHPEVEAPSITVPTGILGAPPSSCNAQADYADIYPLVGATHKAAFLLTGVSHCVFADPGSSFCGFTCSGMVGADKTRLSKKYMTAWFNYYLRHDTGYFDYLYGASSDADIAGGLIIRQFSTAPRGLVAAGLPSVITLTWQPYQHPMVAGYNVYRRSPGQSYTETPYAQVGQVSTYSDTQVVVGQTYSYTLRSHDAAGNLHQASIEVSALAKQTYALYLPLVLK